MTTDNLRLALDWGHRIADRLKKAETISEIAGLNDEVQRYADFVDESFGVPNEDCDPVEKECVLSLLLEVASREKVRQLKYHPEDSQPGDDAINIFEARLDSGDWH